MEENVVDIDEYNEGAIGLTKELKMTAATKHIGVAYHIQRYYITQVAVTISYLPSAQMVADVLRKPLGRLLSTVDNSKRNAV